eukprot:GFYU01027378.1.p1 GENE.GFYU01027378.1~~GFYU01027378.1.p1  ORF type:complete len:189 (+),score=34.71 GFYU01027378.1:77-568(+)
MSAVALIVSKHNRRPSQLKSRLKKMIKDGEAYAPSVPLIQKNRIFGCGSCGLFVSVRSAATIDDNEISECRNCGIKISMMSFCSIRRNKVNSCGLSAIRLEDFCNAVVTKNIADGPNGSAFSQIEGGVAEGETAHFEKVVRVADNVFTGSTSDNVHSYEMWFA